MGMTVKEMRDFMGLSQKQFANHFGMSVRTVQSWEQKARNITGHTYAMMNKIILNSISDGQISQNEAYSLLRQKFGEDDIVENQCFDGYGVCAFYVKSRDLLVDIKNTWYHGGHWFRGDEPNTDYETDDNSVCADWLDKSQYNPLYRRAVEEWTDYDVEQREWLREHNVNYVVFWQEDLSDMQDWVLAGCPDGKDWECEYSWLDSMDAFKVLNGPTYIVFGEDFENLLELSHFELVPTVWDKSVDVNDWQDGQMCYTGDDDNFVVIYYSKELSGFVVGNLMSNILFEMRKK